MSTIQILEKTLADIGIELETVRKRRLASILELRQTMARSESGDRGALYEQAPLNKAIDADGRLVVSLERQIGEVKKQLDLARAQSAAVAAKQASAESASLHPDKWFDVSTPDGRIVRHRHHSLDALRAELQPNYMVRAQIFGADENGVGGFPVAVGQREALIAALAEMGG